MNPAVVLIGQTAIGRDLAPRFAIRIGTAVAMDCVDFEVSNGALLMTRPCYGGAATAEYTSKTLPAVATVRPKSQEPLAEDTSRTGEVRTMTFDTGAVVPRRHPGAGAVGGHAPRGCEGHRLRRPRPRQRRRLRGTGDAGEDTGRRRRRQPRRR